MADFRLLPEQASTLAERVDHLFFALLGIGGSVILLVAILVVLFAIRYRRGAPTAARAALIKGHKLEFVWSLIPLLIFLGLFGWAAWLYMDLHRVPADALEIQAIGKQWMWKFQHPDGQREINELHVPVGKPIKLTLASQDVIHSFYVPAFRVKQDLVPGRFTTVWFTATKVGRYHLFCAEYCGTQHSQMRGQVIVMEPARYEAWLTERGATESLAAQGRRLFRARGCSGCHDPASTVHAPLLDGIFGKTIHLQSGETVVADETYLRDSILLPKKQVVAGFEPIMPSFAGKIEEPELLKIIAYIKSLAEED